MRCYHKLLCTPYKGHVTNEEVRAKIQRETGPHKDLLTIIQRCKMQWYWHVSHSSDLAKTTLQGTVEGGDEDKADRGRGRKTTSGNGHIYITKVWNILGSASCVTYPIYHKSLVDHALCVTIPICHSWELFIHCVMGSLWHSNVIFVHHTWSVTRSDLILSLWGHLALWTYITLSGNC